MPGVETDDEYELVTPSRNTALRCYASLDALRRERGELGRKDTCTRSLGVLGQAPRKPSTKTTRIIKVSIHLT